MEKTRKKIDSVFLLEATSRLAIGGGGRREPSRLEAAFSSVRSLRHGDFRRVTRIAAVA